MASEWAGKTRRPAVTITASPGDGGMTPSVPIAENRAASLEFEPLLRAHWRVASRV
jgi:hypothetical protein